MEKKMPTVNELHQFKISIDTLNRHLDADSSSLPPADYRDYVISSLSYLKQNFSDVTLTVEDVLKEIPFWKNEKYIWPYIMHSQNGSIIFNWRMNGTVIELERIFLDKMPIYLGCIYNSKTIYNPSGFKGVPLKSSKQFLDSISQIISDKYDELETQGINWKAYFNASC